MIYATDTSQLALISAKAADFVAAHDMEAIECGRYDLGDGDYVNVMEYTSKRRPDACYESHVNYADIQMVVSGAELIEIVPVALPQVTSPYDAAADCALYDGALAGEQYLLSPGRFCLAMPADAHMPGVAPDDAPAPVRKAVFKIRVDHVGQ